MISRSEYKRRPNVDRLPEPEEQTVGILECPDVDPMISYDDDDDDEDTHE